MLDALMEESGEERGDIQVIKQSDPEQAAKIGVQLVREAEADFLMKGKLDTAVILKAVVAKDSGLNAGSLMSHVAFLEIPTYHKLVVLTDSGMVIRPDFSQKIKIIHNAAQTLRSMGYEQPKIGLLAAVEKENPQMPETVDAAALTTLNRQGTISGCYVEGPVSYDILMSRESARKKGFSSPVVGNADVLMVGDMATGNILGKALTVSGRAKMAGMVVGAKAPIVLTSRGAHVEEKINSLLLAAACFRDKEESL
jgi:phosphate butyryltransferase